MGSFNKKIFYLLVFVFLACKKDRTCECEVSDTGTSTTHASVVVNFGSVPVVLFDTSFTTSFSNSDSREIILKKTTKNNARKNCISYEEPYTDYTYNSVPNFSLITTKKGVRTYNCKLK